MILQFLRAKHWQIFLLIFVLPFLFQLIIMGSTFVNLAVKIPDFQENPFGAMKYLPLVMLVYVFGLFSWMYSIAIGLQNKTPEGVQMKVNQFKIFFWIPVVYISCFILFMFSLFNNVSLIPGVNPNSIGNIFGIIVPLHLFSMFCMFYIFNFAAKTVKTVELQRKVTFSDYAGEFFLFWFYFVGVWIIQPKANKWIKEGPPAPFENRDN